MDTQTYEKPTVLIENPDARKIEGVSKKTNRPYKFFVQSALFFQPGERWPTPTELTLPDDREGQPFSAGEYDLEYSPYIQRGTTRINVGLSLQKRL